MLARAEELRGEAECVHNSDDHLALPAHWLARDEIYRELSNDESLPAMVRWMGPASARISSNSPEYPPVEAFAAELALAVVRQLRPLPKVRKRRVKGAT